MKKISFKSNNKNIFKFILNIVLKTHKPDKSYKKYTDIELVNTNIPT